MNLTPASLKTPRRQDKKTVPSLLCVSASLREISPLKVNLL
jgi:hypothetical protein